MADSIFTFMSCVRAILSLSLSLLSIISYHGYHGAWISLIIVAKLVAIIAAIIVAIIVTTNVIVTWLL